MSNRLTRVPDEPVPPLPGWGRRCVPPADAVMRALLSRPSSGSLAVTWVTPGTLLLAAVLVVAGVGAGVLCLVAGIGGSRPAVTALGAVALLLAVTSAPLALVGAAQRRALAATRSRRPA